MFPLIDSFLLDTVSDWRHQANVTCVSECPVWLTCVDDVPHQYQYQPAAAAAQSYNAKPNVQPGCHCPSHRTCCHLSLTHSLTLHQPTDVRRFRFLNVNPLSCRHSSQTSTFIAISLRAVEVAFKKPRFSRFLKNLKTWKVLILGF